MNKDIALNYAIIFKSYLFCVFYSTYCSGFYFKKISLRFVRDGILNNIEVQRVVEDIFFKIYS